MALQLYHDEECTQPINASNPDTVKEPAVIGSNIESERTIYLKSDNPNLTYENIDVSATGDKYGATESGEIEVLYRLDGSWQKILVLPDGDYTEPMAIQRMVKAPNVTKAFNRLDIKHKLEHEEYAK